MTTDFTSIRKWYSGKGLKIIDELVLPALAEAEHLGYWSPGTSRKIKAALNKQAAAIKFARENERRSDGCGNRRDSDQGLLEDIADCRGSQQFRAKLRGWNLLFAMMFGAYEKAPELQGLADALRPYAQGEAEHSALDRAKEWVQDFSPVSTLIERLDASRAPPRYVFAEISPTIYANVSKDMGIDFTSIRAPSISWLPGAIFPVIQWPEGTRHAVSRFAHGSVTGSGNQLCESCGHAIKSDNWVPLVADTSDGPVSLWVGRDCAAALFGAKITGKVPRAV